MGVSEASGVNASETTTHGLDDVSQSKSYAHGDKEVNSRTTGQTVFTNQLHGAKSNATALQNGEGNSLADSWSKGFTPSQDQYNKVYKQQMDFLMNVINDQDSGNTDSIGNSTNGDFDYKGDTVFDLQQARGSGINTQATTSSSSFSWDNNSVQKGNSVGTADHGWSSINNQNWALTQNSYVTNNKNAAAFGTNALSKGESGALLTGGQHYGSGNAVGQAEGPKAYSYSNLNGNNFGYGAM